MGFLVPILNNIRNACSYYCIICTEPLTKELSSLNIEKAVTGVLHCATSDDVVEMALKLMSCIVEQSKLTTTVVLGMCAEPLCYLFSATRCTISICFPETQE